MSIAAAATLVAASDQESTEKLRFLPTSIDWSTEVPDGPVSPPVIAGDHVVAALHSGVVVGRRLADGAEAWTAKFVVTAPLAAADEAVIVVVEQAIHALAPDTGQVVWSSASKRVTAPPLVRGGWVIVAAGETLTALRASDGVVVWTRNIGLIEQRSTIDGDVVYVPVAEGRLLALDLVSGSLRWERRVGAKPSEVLAFGEEVYLGAGRDVVCVRAASGVEEWRFLIGAATVGSPAADDTRVYVASMDNLLRAFRRSDGSLEWTQDLGHRPWSGPILAGATVTVPGRSATLRAFDKATRRVLMQLTLPEAAATPPALSLPRNGMPGKLAVIAYALGKPWLLVVAIEAAPPPPLPPTSPLTQLPGTSLPLPKMPA